jgi:thymidylate synthase
MNPAFAIAEVFWILSGSKKALDINFWNPALPKYAGGGDEYHGAYGYRLRNQFAFDQIEKAYEAIRENPNTRQVVLQIWDATTDFPMDNGKPRSPDVPCNICSMLKFRAGKLEWVQVMRSNDIFRGTPYNIIQFTMLQEILAGWLECDVGQYTQYCDSMHLYESDLGRFSVAQELLDIPGTDNLAIPKDDSDVIVREMIRCLGELTSPSISEATLSGTVHSCDLPAAYRNLLLIAGADSARRRGWLNPMHEMARECTNRPLVACWEKWRISKE